MWGGAVLKLRYLGGIIMYIGTAPARHSFIHEQFIIRLRLVVLKLHLFCLWRHESTLWWIHFIRLSENAWPVSSLTLGVKFVDKTETRANWFGCVGSWCILCCWSPGGLWKIGWYFCSVINCREVLIEPLVYLLKLQLLKSFIFSERNWT